MVLRILEDAKKRPELFAWFGTCSSAQIEDFRNRLPFSIPPELNTFWETTGGGDLFESETILGPCHPNESENVLTVSDFCWNRGMPRNLILFHDGLKLSAIQQGITPFVNLAHDTYALEKQFSTFEEWYEQTLRSEYADRYGLDT